MGLSGFSLGQSSGCRLSVCPRLLRARPRRRDFLQGNGPLTNICHKKFIISRNSRRVASENPKKFQINQNPPQPITPVHTFSSKFNRYQQKLFAGASPLPLQRKRRVTVSGYSHPSFHPICINTETRVPCTREPRALMGCHAASRIAMVRRGLRAERWWESEAEG